MGLDAYANAAWGLRTTYGEMQKTFTKTRDWIGPENVDKSHDFDPKTGKPNYETRTELPEELSRWEIVTLSDDAYFDPEEPGERDVPDACECLIVLEGYSTRSSRSGASVEKLPEAPEPRQLASFQADMKKLGLWKDKRFGLWLYLHMSC